jgi:hypothetical protein
MKKYKVLEKYINEKLSFCFRGEYISQEELDNDYITVDYVVNNTMIKSKDCLREALYNKVITGILCWYKEEEWAIYHKVLFIYRKDFEDIALKFFEKVIDCDSAISSLNELGFINFDRSLYSKLYNMGMVVHHPVLRKSKYFDKEKIKYYKFKLAETYYRYRSDKWVKDTLRDRCFGYELYKDKTGTPLSVFCKKKKYSILERGNEFNCFGVQMYSLEGCLDFICEVISRGICYIEGDVQYTRTIDNLTKEELDNFYYTYEEFNQLLDEIGEKLPNKKADTNYFRKYNVNVIKFVCYPSYYLFRKEEVDKLILKSKGFLSKEQLESELRHLTDKKVNREFLEARKITVYNHPTICKKGLYIKQQDLAILKELLIYENQMEDANSIYSLYKIKLSGLKIHLKDIDIINKFDEYVLDKSNNSRARSIHGIAIKYAKLCNVLSNNVEKNILQLPLESKVEKAKDLIEEAFKISDECGMSMAAFVNTHLIPSIDIAIAKEKRMNNEVDKYNADNFTTILISILNILNEPNEFKKLLYNRTASSSILYVLIHFVFAWRKSDILEQLPKPNLKLIGYEDGVKFLEDLTNDKFKFEEYHGERICKDVTEFIYRIDLKAFKNDEQLEASIPSIIYKYLGLLMCICEGNRQYVKKTVNSKYINKKDLISPSGAMNENINKTFELFQIDIEKILGKPFGNLRGNKSFFSVLGERFEELKMCVSKAVSDLRAHKENGKYIPTTGNEYYIEKDISKSTIGIFARETMGCVKEYILRLTESNYELLDDEKQVEMFNSLKMKNTEIEKIHKDLYKRTIGLDKFFKDFDGDKKLAQEFLKELIYGKSYSKHYNCKCLLKAKINANNNIIFERRDDATVQTSCQIRSDNCIGCTYLVASRLFIYEFKDLLNDFFKQFESLQDNISKKVFAIVFKKKYAPLLSAFKSELGEDIFEKVLDITQYKLFYKQIAEIKLIEKGDR